MYFTITLICEGEPYVYCTKADTKEQALAWVCETLVIDYCNSAKPPLDPLEVGIDDFPYWALSCVVTEEKPTIYDDRSI